MLNLYGPTLAVEYLIGIHADDTVIYTRSRSSKIIKRNIQESLNLLEEWYAKRRVTINVTKSEAIMFTR